jgi:hypothetical protein
LSKGVLREIGHEPERLCFGLQSQKKKKFYATGLNKNICNLCNGGNVETCQMNLYKDFKYIKDITKLKENCVEQCLTLQSLID